MARPLTATDQEILDAASRVISRRGLAAFTLSEVAKEVRLTRAAITFRFKSVHDLKRRALERSANRFADLLANQSFGTGGDGLLAIAGFIGSLPGSREALSTFFATYQANLVDEELLAMERRRAFLLRQVTASAMPETPIGMEAAVVLFSTHLTGTLMTWQSSEEPDGRKFMSERTRNWLRMARIPFTCSDEAHARPSREQRHHHHHHHREGDTSPGAADECNADTLVCESRVEL
jgi:AcrR family transcriptional regulator